MQCKKCHKECMESEIIKGFCRECYEKYKGDINKLKNVKNPVAEYLKKCMVIIIVLGIITTIFDMVISFNILVILTIIVSILVTATFIMAVAEIIQLLEDIKNK